MDEKAFWARVEKGRECWEWQGKPNADGYGRLFDAGKLEYAHRYAYLLLVGDIQPGEALYNTCGDRLCVRPEHWTPKRPIRKQESVIKWQKTGKRRRKVTPEQVQAIISISENTSLTQTAIAARYRISQAQVSRILAGLSR